LHGESGGFAAKQFVSASNWLRQSTTLACAANCIRVADLGFDFDNV
jgi:hypothetical protein